MKIVRKMFLMTAIYSIIFMRVGVSQQSAINLPFTLEITANLNKNHSNEWDFANPDRTVLAGDMVVIAVRKTNRSNHEIAKKVQWSGDRVGHQIEVSDSGGALLKANIHVAKAGEPGPGGPMWIIGTKDAVLQPEESYVERDFVSGHPFLSSYDLSQPGKYTIQVSEPVSSEPGAEIIKSNAITVTVVPADTPLFELSIPDHIDVNVGKDFVFNINRKNTSHQDEDCSRLWEPITSLDLRYQFSVLDSSGNPVPKRTIEQPPGSNLHAVLETQTCKPGELTFSPRNVITKLYDLGRPGNYTVQVLQPMSANPADGVVKSNVLSITVYPAGEPLPTEQEPTANDHNTPPGQP